MNITFFKLVQVAENRTVY